MTNIDQEKLLDLFLKIARISGVSLHERLVGDFVLDRLKRLGIRVEEDRTAEKINGNCGNILASIDGKNGSSVPLMLAAHLDTVQSTEFLKPVVESGVVRSDGTTILGADNRAGVAVILYVIEEVIVRKMKCRPLDVVFTVAEEPGMLGSLALDVSRLRAREGYILDCSKQPGSYVTMTPTDMDFKIEFLGKAAHAGVHPEAGVNALSMAIEILAGFPVGRVDKETVANIGVVQGGTATNVVPEHVTASGEVRSFDRAKVDSILARLVEDSQRIAKKYGGRIEFSSTLGFEGFHLDEKTPAIERLRAVLETMGIAPQPLTYYGGSDANVLNGRGIASVNLGIGAQDPHSHDEHMLVKDLAATAELVLQLVQDGPA